MTAFDRGDMISHSDERTDESVKLDSNNHSVFMLCYNLVLVVKYRRKVIDNAVSERLKDIYEYIAPNYNMTLQEWIHNEDHVYILFRAHPNTQISKFINAYKAASSRLIKKEFPHICDNLWNEYFWSRSFCLITAEGAPSDVVKRYIESQSERK